MSRIGFAPPVLLLAAGIGFLAISGAFSEAAQTLPRLVGIAVVVLCALDILSRTPTGAGRAMARWLNPAGLREPGTPPEPRRLARQSVAVTGVLGLVAGMVLVGILPSVAVFALLAFRFGAHQRWVVSVSVAGGIVAMIWLLFGALLGLPLFPGLLLGGDVD